MQVRFLPRSHKKKRHVYVALFLVRSNYFWHTYEMHIFTRFFIVVGLVLFGMTQAFAHGDVTMQQKKVGNYTVEFEYQEKNILAGVPAQYIFYLLDTKTQETIPLDSMFVRFADSENNLVLAGKLKTTEGLSGTGRIQGIMPVAGEYTASLEFLKGDTKIANATFPFNVVPTEQSPTASSPMRYTWLLALVGGVVLGMGVGKKIAKK
jgi:hypothetical protein